MMTSIPAVFSDPAWQQCYQDFLANLEQQGECASRCADYQSIIARFFGDRPASGVAPGSREDVEEFCHALSGYGRMPSHRTIKRRRAALRDFYDYASSCGLHHCANPARPPTVTKPDVFDDERWQQCYEHFLNNLQRRTGSTATGRSYSGILRAFFSQVGKHPENVTRADIEAFLSERSQSWSKTSDRRLAAATINKRCTSLRSFYDFASGYTIMGPDGHPQVLFDHANPTARIGYGQPRRAYKTLSLDEIKRFFAAVRDQDNPIFAERDTAVFLTYLLTCRRRAEVARLTWGDLEYGLVADDDGSTREAWKYSFTGKGRSSIRDCAEMPQAAMDAILHYLKVAGRLDTMQPDSPLFAAHVNQHGPSNVRAGEVRQLSEHAIVNRLHTYAARAGIDSHKISLHSFRHSGAFLRKISGADLLSVSKTLRHKSLDQTRHYLEGLSTNSDKESKLVEARLTAQGVM